MVTKFDRKEQNCSYGRDRQHPYAAIRFRKVFHVYFSIRVILEFLEVLHDKIGFGLFVRCTSFGVGQNMESRGSYLRYNGMLDSLDWGSAPSTCCIGKCKHDITQPHKRQPNSILLRREVSTVHRSITLRCKG